MWPDCLSLCVLNLFIALGVNYVLQINNTEKGVSKQLNQVETQSFISTRSPTVLNDAMA